jgi:hypothetical protein
MTIFRTILQSRFKKTNESDDVERKRAICKKCEYNSLNLQKIEFKKRALIKLSDFYSWITGNKKKDNLGNCTSCDSCSILYKTVDEQYCPHPTEDKWKTK